MLNQNHLRIVQDGDSSSPSEINSVKLAVIASAIVTITVKNHIPYSFLSISRLSSGLFHIPPELFLSNLKNGVELYGEMD